MKGSVYLIIMMDDNETLYKIGFTTKEPINRLKALQTGCPHELRILNVFESDHYLNVETAMHNRYFGSRQKGEWFKLTDEQITDFTANCQKFHNTFQFLHEAGNPYV